MESTYLEQVELHMTKIVEEEFSDKLIFHNIKHIKKIVEGARKIAVSEDLDEAETELILIASWLIKVGFKDLDNWKVKKDVLNLFDNCVKCSIMETRQFLIGISFPKEKIDKVVAIMNDASSETAPLTLPGKILADAITIEWASKKGIQKIRKQYQEFLLLDVFAEGKESFYNNAIEYLETHEYRTAYGEKNLQPKTDKLITDLKKNRKDIDKQGQLALKKELNVSDDELKRLKKSLKSVEGRDEKGIQTMFRTTSRNHYTLNQMVDKKANIMISVNAIILSLIVSRLIGGIETFCIHNAPILVLLLSSVVSIVFSIIAITPAKHHGEFSEKEVRSKEGNLLFFGNYHNMSLRDYNWGVLEMLNDSDYLYSSLIRDQYFLGKLLSRKNKFIRNSLNVFMIGIVITVILFLIAASMGGFHIGGGAH